MNPQVQHRITVLSESIRLTVTFFLIRIGLKQVTIDERHQLKERVAQVRELIRQERMNNG
jgi:hypothetical protein